MPTKTKHYRWVKFPEEAIREALQAFQENVSEGDVTDHRWREVEMSADESWQLDTDEEFYAEYRRDVKSARYEYAGFLAQYAPFGIAATVVSVRLADRASVEGVFSVFERWVERGRIQQPVFSPTIFIGHGRAADWKELRDRLRDHHNLDVRAFESDPRAGQAVQQVLEEELDRASFALLVHTAEDEQQDEQVRARQNVIHETGLFQGRLGFERTIILREEGCESFSNLAGVQEVRYSKGHVLETISEVLATIRREFPASE